jgi:hypothetical protein
MLFQSHGPSRSMLSSDDKQLFYLKLLISTTWPCVLPHEAENRRARRPAEEARDRNADVSDFHSDL